VWRFVPLSRERKDYFGTKKFDSLLSCRTVAVDSRKPKIQNTVGCWPLRNRFDLLVTGSIRRREGWTNWTRAGKKERGEGCSAAWEKIARNKSIQFPANRSSGSLGGLPSRSFSPTRPTGVAREERARRADSCFSQLDTRCQMQSAKRETPRIANRGDRDDLRYWTKSAAMPKSVGFRLYYSDATWHFNYLYRAISSTMKSPRYVSLVSAFVLDFLMKIPLIYVSPLFEYLCRAKAAIYHDFGDKTNVQINNLNGDRRRSRNDWIRDPLKLASN